MDDTSGRVDSDTGDAAGRATEKTRGYGADEPANVDDRTREIRQEIEETRGEMTETIDAIQEKLKPRNIMAQATDRVKSAATERVRDMADTASQTAQQAMDYTRARTDRVVRSARQNPIPLALIGVGAAWLLTKQARRSPSRPPAGGDVPNYSSGSQQPWYEDERETGLMAMIRDHPVPAAFAGVGLSWLALASGQRREDARGYGRMPAWGDRTGQWSNRASESRSDVSGTDVSVTGAANEIASRTKEYAAETADSMKRMARRRQNQLQRMVQENPLLVGAGALMLGAAFGLAVPETEVENEWMGEARDTMVDRARDMARDAANQVPEVARSVADAAQNVAGKTQP